MTDLPIACTLLEAERQRRRSEVLERVFGRVQETRPLDDGYTLRFSPDEGDLAGVMDLIQLERLCCPFLKFRLTLEPAGGPVWLELTGPPGTKAFLESAMGLGSPAQRSPSDVR